MDPDANLDEQLSIAADMLDEESDSIDTGDAVRLAELVVALNEWITKGGFLPRGWRGDAATAINRFSSHPDTCICNGAPHRRGMGCM